MQETKAEIFKGIFPKRNVDSNKNTFGRVTIIGGSSLYNGAPLLSYNALISLRMGSGYSTLVVPSSIYPNYIANAPQVILQSMKANKDGFFEFNALELDEIMKKSTVIAFGMGAGIREENAKIASYLLTNFEGTLILDADALNSIIGKLHLLKNAKPKVIITPHIGEFARLVNSPISFIKEHKEKFASDFAKKTGVIVVLKDYQTIITDGKETYLNRTGNTGLAKAGSGDMLDGILAGLFAWIKNESHVKIAALGSYILGKTSENIALHQPEFTIIAEDIIKEIPNVINSIL